MATLNSRQEMQATAEKGFRNVARAMPTPNLGRYGELQALAAAKQEKALTKFGKQPKNAPGKKKEKEQIPLAGADFLGKKTFIEIDLPQGSKKGVMDDNKLAVAEKTMQTPALKGRSIEVTNYRSDIRLKRTPKIAMNVMGNNFAAMGDGSKFTSVGAVGLPNGRGLEMTGIDADISNRNSKAGLTLKGPGTVRMDNVNMGAVFGAVTQSTNSSITGNFVAGHAKMGYSSMATASEKTAEAAHTPAARVTANLEAIMGHAPTARREPSARAQLNARTAVQGPTQAVRDEGAFQGQVRRRKLEEQLQFHAPKMAA